MSTGCLERSGVRLSQSVYRIFKQISVTVLVVAISMHPILCGNLHCLKIEQDGSLWLHNLLGTKKTTILFTWIWSTHCGLSYACSRLGTPDELRELINIAHEMGINVLMDVMHGFASENALVGLDLFDRNNECHFRPGWRSCTDESGDIRRFYITK